METQVALASPVRQRRDFMAVPTERGSQAGLHFCFRATRTIRICKAVKYAQYNLIVVRA